jgi:beta-alanine degradation protein BauB
MDHRCLRLSAAVMGPVVMAAVLMGFAAVATAQDPVAASPEEYKLEIENTWVRVIRVNQAAHHKTPMHQHPASVVVYLTDAHERVVTTDGETQEVFHKAGDVAYIEPVKHSEENLSDSSVRGVVVELKPGAPPIHPPRITLDPVKLDPEHHLVPVENDRVRVLRTILVPHLKSPMHEHPAYVVVYLTELHTTQLLGDGRLVDNPRMPGDLAWRDPLKHQTENIGDHTAVEIQIELK